VVVVAKLNDLQRKEIIAKHINGSSYRVLAEAYDVSPSTIRDIVKSDPETTQKYTQKKEENTASVLAHMEKTAGDVCEILDLLREAMKSPSLIAKTPMAQLATTYGILVDKHAGTERKADEQGDDTSDKIPYRMDPTLIADHFAPVHRSILLGKHSEYVLDGGRGSTKSSCISLLIIEHMINNPEQHVLCVRQVADTLSDSVYAQLEWAIGIMGLESSFKCMKTPLKIIYTPTGQQIYFRGADVPNKIKSIKPKCGHIGLLWFEEYDQFRGPEQIRSVVQSAIRGGDRAIVFKSFNPPRTAISWANKELLIPKQGRMHLRSTYKDVPPEWLGKAFLDEAEHLQQVNPDAYEHEYLGVANGTGGQVFSNVTLREITDQEIQTIDYSYQGIDWGWFPDPFVWLKIGYDPAKSTIWIYDELWRNKKSNRDVYDLLVDEKGYNTADLITADSAEPKSVSDFRDYGAFIRGAEKGPDSVRYSMKWFASIAHIIIDHVRCPRAAKEFTEYEHEKTKDGEILSTYPDRYNHSIDATRYALESVWKRRGQ
jgi:PBSX family phage terminase large subunit